MEVDANNGVSGQPSSRSIMHSINALWAKIGLDTGSALSMAKFALSPTIAIAMYRSTSIALHFEDNGYLIAIVSLLAFAPNPRIKFVQALLFDILFVCLSAAVNTLAAWSSLQARKHTTPAGQPLEGYNSSASAVCAIWFVFQVWIDFSIKSAYIQLKFPTIMYAILMTITMTTAPRFTTKDEIFSFISLVLQAMLTGLAIATGVHFVFFPTNARQPVFADIRRTAGKIEDLLEAQNVYINGIKQFRHDDSHIGDKPSLEAETQSDARKALSAATQELLGSHAKFANDLVLGKQEVAIGAFDANDLSNIFKLMRKSIIPLMGTSALLLEYGEGTFQETCNEEKAQIPYLSERREARKKLYDLSTQMQSTSCVGYAHILDALNIHRSKRFDDEERRGEQLSPGSANFPQQFYARLQSLAKQKEDLMLSFERIKRLMETDSDGISGSSESDEGAEFFKSPTSLCTVELIWEHLTSLYHFLEFVESITANGLSKRKRLILPGYRRSQKLVTKLLVEGDETDRWDTGEQQIEFGQAFRSDHDLDHLPAKTTWQRVGNFIRRITPIMRSRHTIFGLRVVAAAMTIAILAYLRTSQIFFGRQRGFWAIIIMMIAMSPTAGQSFFNFWLRILGTAIAMAYTITFYYVVDGTTAGIIVFMFIWITCAYYIILKYPAFTGVAMIVSITSIIIWGYELQVRKIGVSAATTNGQPAYPIYLLAPYRFLLVTIGMVVGFFWTIFPFPLSDHLALRQNLSACLFFLGNYQAVTQETIAFHGAEASGMDESQRKAIIEALEKARRKVHTKALSAITTMRSTYLFVRWEFQLGGKFPLDTYESLVQTSDECLLLVALIATVSEHLGRYLREGSPTEAWKADLRALQGEIMDRSADITLLLCFVATSLSDGKPLPPHMRPLRPFPKLNTATHRDSSGLEMDSRMKAHYAYEVMCMASMSLVTHLNDMTDQIKGLLGELDFSVHPKTKSS